MSTLSEPTTATELVARADAVVAERAVDLLELSHQVHDLKELAFEEHRSTAALCELLAAAGFDVRAGVAGMPTAFTATYGSGRLAVGVCAEYDALPEIGHACGHNVIAASGVGAGLALAAVADDLDLTVTVLGTPAEEHGGGKALMLEAGLFDDLACAVMVHPGAVDVRPADPSAQGVARFAVAYAGRAAHAAAAPHLGVNAADMAPEKNRTYEIGTKWDVLNKSVSLTAAVFRTETVNARITLPDGDYAMAGRKQVDGLELGITGAITPKWNVYGGYTYLHSKIKDDGVATDEGNRFPNTPENSFSLWSTYKVMPKLTLGAGAYYGGKQYGNAANTNYIPSYWRFDAMAGYRINKHVGVQLNVFNVFNKTYYDQAYAAHYASIAPGRSAILNVSLSY